MLSRFRVRALQSLPYRLTNIRSFSSMVEDKQEQSTARRDQLVDIEKVVRQEWSSAKLFERDAPTDPVKRAAKNKFMATFPYPYMNGSLHLGHAFSVVKAEYAVRFQRLMGKETLFPFGFHCTGMPIAACAEKLRKEVAAFGNPPVFPQHIEAEEIEEADEVVSTSVAQADTAAVPEKKVRKKKGKLAGKSSKEVYQWNIMKEMNVPESEIALFQDPLHWLQYFPPIAIQDLTDLGLAVDWRRAFITTDVNPYYDAFIRWQFNTLRSKSNKLAFGKLMCICTPSNKQVCADHDRSVGEGVTTVAYTLIKLRMVDELPTTLTAMLEKAGMTGATVTLPAATLRPETMYGQTNAFVLPTGTYQVYKISDNEVYVCTRRSALNMAHQGIFEGDDFVYGEPDSRFLGDISGQELLGRALVAPYSKYEKVYTLPLLTISMEKGTGVVTSVPSDSPADYSALMDMKNKKEFRAKYAIQDFMVEPFDVIPVIRIDELDTEEAAPMLCKKYGVKSQNDAILINKIKDEIYNLGFGKGVMVAGKYSGSPVKDVKEQIKQDLIDAGFGVAYSEPESRVVSRTDEECVAASIDQWFLNYGEDEWKNQIKEHVESEHFNPTSKPVLNRLRFTIDWLQKWGCSRAFGLGTRLPFEDRYVIESLSDSTIYMAYYTIAALLQGGATQDCGKIVTSNLDGSIAGPAQVTPAQLNDALFNYIFLDTPYSSDILVSEEVVAKMKSEFEYWYPMDLRVSGKDLLNNHLVMSLYNHAAVWDGRSDRMPQSYYANGLLTIDNQKMSKSTGNFMTLAQALNKYGADATRFGLASSGDSLEDANFSSQIANNAILRLTRELAFIEETMVEIKDSKLREGDLNFWDRSALSTFGTNVREARNAYAQMRMLDVVRFACHDFCNARDQYRLACAESGVAMHRDILIQWIRDFAIILSPVCPFWCQRVWEILIASGLYDTKSMTKFVFDASWPFESENKVDATALRESSFVNISQSNIRGTHAKTVQLLTKKLKSKSPVVLNKLTIKVASSYPAWQVQIIEKLSEIVSSYVPDEDAAAGTNALSAPIVATTIKNMFANHPNKKMITMAMSFTASVKADFAERGLDALELVMPFDEKALIQDHLGYLIRGLEPITVDTTVIEAFVPSEDVNVTGGPIPGKPQFVFEHDPTSVN